MSGAIISGETIDTCAIDYHVSTCERCGWRFHNVDKVKNVNWCKECNEDILFDREECKFLQKNGRIYCTFFGWNFELKQAFSPCIAEPVIYVFLWKKLLNPEKENFEYSQSNFPIDGDKDIDRFRNYACAWLIAHWWEHALNICPCINGMRDDEKGSRFRQHVIDSLMWYHQQGLS